MYTYINKDDVMSAVYCSEKICFGYCLTVESRRILF